MTNTAAVILAGGKSRRMGRDKLALDFGGMSLLESAVERFNSEFSESVYISVGDPEKYAQVKALRIVDIYPGTGPLSGLHAALATIPAPNDGVFLIAADLPFASAHAAKHIITLRGNSEVCVIKLPDGRLEPLFAYYSKSLLQRCEDQIKSGDYRMSVLINNANVRYVEPQELGAYWDEKMIWNINNPDDYARIRGLM